MNVELIVVGKTDMKEVEALVTMYTKRINHYVRFAITTIADVRTHVSSPRRSRNAWRAKLYFDLSTSRTM